MNCSCEKRPKPDAHDRHIEEGARAIAESFGYEWESLHETKANWKSGNRVPSKEELRQAAFSCDAAMANAD